MKKALCIILSLLMVLALFAACGGSSDNGGENGKSVSGKEDTAEAEIEEEEEYEEISFNDKGTIAETVMYDKEPVKITAIGLSYDEYSATLELLIENSSEKKDYTVISESLGYSCNSVNGIMVPDGYLNCTVTAGNKVNEEISFDFEALMMFGINEIADMEIGFEIQDEDDNSIYTGPISLKTSLANGYEYNEKCYQQAINSKANESAMDYTVKQFSDTEIYSEKGVSIVSCAVIEKDESEGMFLEVVNDTADQVIVTLSDICINGMLVKNGNWTSETVNAGKRGIIDITLSDILADSYPEAFGIEEIGLFSMDVTVKNMDYKETVKAKTIDIELPGKDKDVDKTGTQVYAKNNITITYKGVFAGGKSYDNDLHAIFIAENTGDKEIAIDNVYDSLSINGFMCDYTYWGANVPAGKCAIMDVAIDEAALEKNSITAESISELKMNLEIRDTKYNNIDKPKIEYKVSE